MTRFRFAVFSLYLFCDGLLYNLVKTGQVENVTNSTQLVVNFRSLEFNVFSGNLQFLGYLQEVGLNPTDQGYLADLEMNKLHKIFFKQLLTRGLNTTRSIPRRPKSEIFAGIPFTWREKG